MGLMFMAPNVTPATAASSSESLVASRVIMNDSSALWAQESLWLMTEQFADGVVSSSDDLIVRLVSDSSAFRTQVQTIGTHASGYTDIVALWLGVPANKMASGSNSVSVLKFTGARSTASAISASDIAARNIKLRFTNTRNWSNTTDGSGTFDSEVNTVLNTGDPLVRQIARGPVVDIREIMSPALDTVGGAAQAAGLYGAHWIVSYQNSGGTYDHSYWMPFVHMGDTGNADPDVRRFDVDLYMDGGVIAGDSAGWGEFSDQYLPYYARPSLGNSRGLGWCSAPTKVPPFRNIAPFSVWSARDRLRLPPFAANKFDGSGAIWVAPTLSDAQTIATTGSDQGKITITGYDTWEAQNNGADLPGANWVRFEATAYPTGVSADRAYCLGADSGGKFYIYPTRADAIAGTNKVIPSTGGISAGTSVVVYPAHAPMSMPTGFTGWGSTGERAELGLASTLAWMAIMQPSKGNMDALRSSALNLGYVGFQYRGTTTFRVPDIQTDTATYAGLGTGSGTTFSQDLRFGGPHGMVQPTQHTSSNWYEETLSGIFPDNNHPPSCDYFYAWMLEPWPWFADIALSWAVGLTTWGLAGDRNPTWNGVQIVNSSYGGFFDNVRARAWRMRSILPPIAMWPETIVAGTNGERPMLDAFATAQTTQETQMLIYSTANTPNGKGMGLLPIQMGPGWSNWQYGAYLISTCGLFYGYTGLLGLLLAAMKPYGLAFGGNVGTASGTMGPTRAGTYYAGGRSYVSTDLYDAPAAQWNAYGVSDTVITLDTVSKTVTVPLAANIPDTFARASSGDLFTLLRTDTGAVVDSSIGFDTPRYTKNLTVSGFNAIFQLSATPGGATISFTSSTVTNALWSWHHPSEAAYGFYNVQFSNLYPTQNLAATFILSWVLGGMNTELTAVNSALENYLGVGVEPDLGIDSKYAYDVTICTE